MAVGTSQVWEGFPICGFGRTIRLIDINILSYTRCNCVTGGVPPQSLNMTFAKGMLIGKIVYRVPYNVDAMSPDFVGVLHANLSHN